MSTIFFVFLGLIIGGMLAEEKGLIIGLFMDLTFGMMASLKRRILQLDQDLARTKKSFNNARSNKDETAQT